MCKWNYTDYVYKIHRLAKKYYFHTRFKKEKKEL